MITFQHLAIQDLEELEIRVAHTTKEVMEIISMAQEDVAKHNPEGLDDFYQRAFWMIKIHTESQV